MRYADAHEKAKRLVENSLQSLAGKVNTTDEKGIPVIVFNSLNWERTSPLTVQMSFDPKSAKSIILHNKDGKDVPVQLENVSRDEAGYLNSAEITFVASDVPSIGYDTYYIVLSDRGRCSKE